MAAKTDAVFHQHLAMHQVMHRLTDENAVGELRSEQFIAIRRHTVSGRDVPSLVRIVEALTNARDRKRFRCVGRNLLRRLDRQLRIASEVMFR